MEIKKKIFLSFTIITICFIMDRLSKIYIIDLFSQSNVNENIYINPYLNFILLWNKGIAFGLFQSEQIFYHLVSGIILMVIILLIFLLYKAQKKWEMIYFSLIVGGAIGNFFDRIYYNAVPDFIDLHYEEFHWFTFNVADMCITIGIILYLIFDMFKFKNKDNE
tara:strand:+ start:1237 stop:1728 length:492 start_codon:yes stop_codon:yes gene_type:complete